MGFRQRCFGRVCLLTAALVSCCAPAAQATFPGQNGKIAFGGGVPPGGVSVIEPDGSGLSLVVPDGIHPAWSSDGQRLAYFRHDVGLHVANGDGSGETSIRATSSSGTTTTSRVNQFLEPAWSPDGGTIAYEENEFRCAQHAGCFEYPQGIRAIGPDGSGDRQLIGLGASPGASDPAYSPDGTRIAWSEHRAFTLSEIHVSNSDGTGDTVLTESDPDTGVGQAWDPSWSPDGTRIAFARSTAPNRDAEIFVMNADGSNQTRLTFRAMNDDDPAWSPDGTKIAWSYDGRLWVMNADGSAQSQLTPDGVFGRTPDWQALPGPRREDYRNATQFCRAELRFLGGDGFREKYGSMKACKRSNR